MREYVLALPDSYDASQPYKLIFAWHWRGGVANDVVSGSIIGGPYYGLEQRAEGSAIFVAPEGIDNGWANTGGRDITFLKAMLALFDSKLCIDHERIFSLGFSYGGMMSDAIGCEMADVFRAIAPMSGAFYSGCKDANDHPIAVWLAHGDNDTVVPLADGEEALDFFLARNQCQAQTSPVDPSPPSLRVVAASLSASGREFPMEQGAIGSGDEVLRIVQGEDGPADGRWAQRELAGGGNRRESADALEVAA